ncbi:hypothetical protein B296_00036099, partial [Ensete ventricosum]
ESTSNASLICRDLVISFPFFLLRIGRVPVAAGSAVMSDVTVPSRYVKLTKDQDVPLEEIRPGELNQPVRVPQVRVFNVELDSYLFWRFADVPSAGNPCLKAMNPQLTKLGPPGYVDVLRILRAVRSVSSIVFRTEK